MLWVLVDVLIGLVALLILVGVVLSGIRHIKQLSRAAKKSGERVGAVTAQIDALQRQGPSHRTP